MRRPALAALVICLAAGLLSACGTVGGHSDLKLVWSDEFDGPNGSLPDADNWVLEQYADATDDEKQCYTNSPDNAHLDGGGYLVIAALEQPGHCADGWYRFITSARLTTKGLHSWEHGKFEIRAKMPTGVGTWPAFWAHRRGEGQGVARGR